MTRSNTQSKQSISQRSERLRLSTLFAVGGAALAVLSLGAAGCGDRQSADEGAGATTTVVSNAEPGTTTVTTTTAPTPAPMPSVPASTESVNAGPGDANGTQAEVADAVNTRIIRNPQMTGSRINVVVDSVGVATLTGFTQNQQQKALATRAAENTPGVVSVLNKLEIRPTGGTGKAAPKPSPTPAPPTTTNVIVVPGPAASPAPTPAPSASPLEGFEEGGEPRTEPTPAPAPLPTDGE